MGKKPALEHLLRRARFRVSARAQRGVHEFEWESLWQVLRSARKARFWSPPCARSDSGGHLPGIEIDGRSESVGDLTQDFQPSRLETTPNSRAYHVSPPARGGHTPSARRIKAIWPA